MCVSRKPLLWALAWLAGAQNQEACILTCVQKREFALSPHFVLLHATYTSYIMLCNQESLLKRMYSTSVQPVASARHTFQRKMALRPSCLDDIFCMHAQKKNPGRLHCSTIFSFIYLCRSTICFQNRNYEYSIYLRSVPRNYVRSNQTFRYLAIAN